MTQPTSSISSLIGSSLTILALGTYAWGCFGKEISTKASLLTILYSEKNRSLLDRINTPSLIDMNQLPSRSLEWLALSVRSSSRLLFHFFSNIGTCGHHYPRLQIDLLAIRAGLAGYFLSSDGKKEVYLANEWVNDQFNDALFGNKRGWFDSQEKKREFLVDLLSNYAATAPAQTV